ncbi:unnamed protein product [Rotaria sp. Silwood1]|nr:unnamed protein product [Rotaria sp. Silwood1]
MPDVHVDMEIIFNKFVPKDNSYERSNEGKDDIPTDAKCSLFGSLITRLITSRRLIIGTWEIKSACCTTINKFNCTPLDEGKSDKIRQMIRRRMNKTRFVSESIEWILQTDQADFKAYQYSTKLETYGQDPQFYELIDYIKRNYLEKDLQRIEDIDTVVKYFNLTINTRDPFYLLQAYTAETGFYSTLNVHLTQLHLENLTDKENLSKIYYLEIIARHPKSETLSYTGKAYRGMMITNNDLKQYKIGTRILTKTFSSS